MPGSALEPLRIPSAFWQRTDVREVLQGRDVGRLFQLIHKYVRSSQTQIGIATGLPQGTVSQVMNGLRELAAFDVIERVADGLGMPDEARMMFGLAPRRAVMSRGETASSRSETARDTRSQGQIPELTVEADDDWIRSMRRRAVLAGGLGAAVVPTVMLDDLHRIVAALDAARRDFDGNIAEYLRRQLAKCAAEDGARGPRATLPAVLGIVGVVSRDVRDVGSDIRRELLTVGAHAAEFAGWLYRDIGLPEQADYWRDRAMEWAQAAGNLVLQAYILLKKSQAAWDQRDAPRMLTLAQAVQDGPWQLPLRMQAEAAQQEARGQAMLGAPIDLVDRTLDDARQKFADDTSSPEAGSYNVGLLLAMQTAICYQEAGQPERALATYETTLLPKNFSRRDYGYFLSLQSAALAAARQPDHAAATGLRALTVASSTKSLRTLGELERVVTALQPWEQRPAVRELRAAVFAL